MGLGLEVLGPDWGAGAGAGLEGAGYPDVVGLCSTRNPMGLKHLLGGFWELSREGVRFALKLAFWPFQAPNPEIGFFGFFQARPHTIPFPKHGSHPLAEGLK